MSSWRGRPGSSKSGSRRADRSGKSRTGPKKEPRNGCAEPRDMVYFITLMWQEGVAWNRNRASHSPQRNWIGSWPGCFTAGWSWRPLRPGSRARPAPFLKASRSRRCRRSWPGRIRRWSGITGPSGRPGGSWRPSISWRCWGVIGWPIRAWREPFPTLRCGSCFLWPKPEATPPGRRCSMRWKAARQHTVCCPLKTATRGMCPRCWISALPTRSCTSAGCMICRCARICWRCRGQGWRTSAGWSATPRPLPRAPGF